jgi:hypothetical protein
MKCRENTGCVTVDQVFLRSDLGACVVSCYALQIYQVHIPPSVSTRNWFQASPDTNIHA